MCIYIYIYTYITTKHVPRAMVANMRRRHAGGPGIRREQVCRRVLIVYSCTHSTTISYMIQTLLTTGCTEHTGFAYYTDQGAFTGWLARERSCRASNASLEIMTFGGSIRALYISIHPHPPTHPSIHPPIHSSIPLSFVIAVHTQIYLQTHLDLLRRSAFMPAIWPSVGLRGALRGPAGALRHLRGL